jgi:hypothetical protein
VLVVSIAEVVVCWALFGAVLRNALGSGSVPVAIAVVSAAAAFGVYHFAHSPPFNTPGMVLLLSGVGVATGIFFFLGGDLYSTVVLHNTFAIRGVVQALAAIAAVVVLIIADVALIRPHARGCGVA